MNYEKRRKSIYSFVFPQAAALFHRRDTSLKRSC